MKSSAEALASTSGAEKNLAAVLADLIKARLTALVLLTTFVGFYLGERGAVNYLPMFHALFGTALVASGAAALNQWLERDYDAKMRRTASRPLPSGRLQPATVAIATWFARANYWATPSTALCCTKIITCGAAPRARS